MGYSDIVLEHLEHPHNRGPLEGADVSGQADFRGNPPHAQLWLKWEGDRIGQARFETVGCGAAIAAGSMLTQLLQGRTRAECLALTVDDLDAALQELPLHKRFCAAVWIDCLRSALGTAPEGKG